MLLIYGVRCAVCSLCFERTDSRFCTHKRKKKKKVNDGQCCVYAQISFFFPLFCVNWNGVVRELQFISFVPRGASRMIGPTVRDQDSSYHTANGRL